MGELYFSKGSKNFKECSSSERSTILSLLKEELNLTSKNKWFTIYSFRNQAHFFVVRLKNYIFNNPGEII